MMRDATLIAQTFRKYTQAFQAGQTTAVTGYFQKPCMFISSEGVRLMVNANELEAFIAQITESLKSRGFSHSEISDMRVNQMQERLALVSVRRIRYKADGGELERLGETYTLRKVDGEWKIVAAMPHEPEAILTLV